MTTGQPTPKRNTFESDPIRTKLEELQRGSGRRVDEFFWRGDPNAKPIQRAALLLFSSLILFFSVMFVIAAIWLMPRQDLFPRTFGLVMGGVSGLIGGRLFFNALRH